MPFPAHPRNRQVRASVAKESGKFREQIIHRAAFAKVCNLSWFDLQWLAEIFAHMSIHLEASQTFENSHSKKSQ